MFLNCKQRDLREMTHLSSFLIYSASWCSLLTTWLKMKRSRREERERKREQGRGRAMEVMEGRLTYLERGSARRKRRRTKIDEKGVCLVLR